MAGKLGTRWIAGGSFIPPTLLLELRLVARQRQTLASQLAWQGAGGRSAPRWIKMLQRHGFWPATT